MRELGYHGGMRVLAVAVVLAAAAVYAGCSDDGATAPADAGASGVDGSQGQDAIAPDGGTPDASDDASDAADPACVSDGGLPDDLRCTGLYSNFAAKTVAPSARAYAPGAPFWSDGADKSRWVSLPPGTKIDSSNMDEWIFPSGTKFWKEFKVGGKRVETRLFSKTAPRDPSSDAGIAYAATWEWTTYKWSSDESTATRLDSGATNVNGTTYEIPSQAQCDQCHSGKDDKILGFEALNMGLAGASGVTLSVLASEGRLTNAPATTTFAIPEDATGKARDALSWLHGNCSACHNANQNAGALFTGLFLRVRTAELTGDGGAARVQDLDAYKTAVNQDPKALTAFKNQGFKLIAAHDVAFSLIPKLAAARNVSGVPQMPPIVTHIADDAGVAKINDWISGLPDGGL
jgi:hypothetical protein